MNPKTVNAIIASLRENEVMNEYDLDNLEFLLKQTKESLMKWFEAVEDEDHYYAKELLIIAQNYFSDDAINIDTTQAKQVLQRFML